MSINSTIRTAITPIVAVCVPDVYTGTATEYCTFNYSELPEIFADGKPDVIRYLVQLHWMFPRNTSPFAKKKQIKNALHNAGLTYPSVTNASDSDGGHLIFECEATDGEV
jgi:hypothetical protein